MPRFQTKLLNFGKLITVMGAAGGVGTTTLATNLAVELAALAERQVSIVDLDYRFGQVATLLDVEPTYTLSDLCNSPEQLEQQVIEREREQVRDLRARPVGADFRVLQGYDGRHKSI